MNKTPIRPVTILTGFLGTGKTTYLNALMKYYSNKRFAIIENELGTLNVDGMLLSKNYGQLIELQEGCICCTLNDDFYRSLESLLHNSDHFDELVIECTGLAIPAGVIEPFTMHPIFKKYFPLKRIICLVDASLIEDQIHERDEVLRQLTASDVIMINKTTEVQASYCSYLQEVLFNINPLATIVTATNRNDFPFEAIDKVIFRKKNESFSFLRNQSINTRIISSPVIANHHITDICTKTYTFRGEFNFIHLYLGLSKLVGKYNNKIYRMKGICYKTDEDKKIILQTVGSRVDMDYGSKWQKKEIKTNTMVFIGKELESLPIEPILKQILTTSPIEMNKLI